MTRDLMIGELKKIKPSYNYDRYDDKQIFRMYQKYVIDKAPRKDVVTQQPSSESVITPTEKSIEDYAQEYDDKIGYKTCDNCGTRLNDMGTCPRCDEGEEDLTESYNSLDDINERDYSGFTSYEFPSASSEEEVEYDPLDNCSLTTDIDTDDQM